MWNISSAVHHTKDTVDIMADEELMFSMEEVGSARKDRPRRAPSTSDANSDDEDDDYYICPITDDPMSPAKEICGYLKNLIHDKQLSSPSPRNFNYRAAWKHAIEKAKAMPDPWAEFHLEDIETEPCIRYRSACPPFCQFDPAV